jgi:hypothetical protein
MINEGGAPRKKLRGVVGRMLGKVKFLKRRSTQRSDGEEDGGDGDGGLDDDYARVGGGLDQHAGTEHAAPVGETKIAGGRFSANEWFGEAEAVLAVEFGKLALQPFGGLLQGDEEDADAVHLHLQRGRLAGAEAVAPRVAVIELAAGFSFGLKFISHGIIIAQMF